MAEDWTKIQDVFDYLESKNERTLTEGEKELIRGQRQINRKFFNVINAILETVSPSANAEARSPDPLAAVKAAFQTIPGERPPGCASEPEG
jgi:hypothetical protein